MNKKALLLINVGTPKQPTKKDVRRFLSEFLNDPRVIDLPWLFRKILVNLIIIPFRTKKSTELYKRLWTGDGSPILIYLESLRNKLQLVLKDNCDVYASFRYGEPSLENTLNSMKGFGYSELIIFPLFPQYASSTTETALERVMTLLKKWEKSPTIQVVNQFYDHPAFIKLFSRNILKHDLSKYDHILFTYHGLPLSHIQKFHSNISFENCNCELVMPPHGKMCYKATCYETTRLILKELGAYKVNYSVGFQSRLTNKWLSPFSDNIVINLAKAGSKNLLVVAPSFVADCLETIIEIEQDYSSLYKSHGGINLTLVNSLNDTEEWAQAITIIKKL